MAEDNYNSQPRTDDGDDPRPAAYLAAEARARMSIDAQLVAAGWVVQDRSALNLHAGPGPVHGVAVREFVMRGGHGRADYLLFVDREPVGSIEAKPEGTTLTGVEEQSAKYVTGLPDGIPSRYDTLSFAYESTSAETRFTNMLDPEPRSRRVFTFHRPETLARWLREATERPDARTLRARLRQMPVIDRRNLRRAQAEAIEHLEQSLAEDRPRALIQMATGSGKTFAAANMAYRLIKHAGARRILFLVDRGNLGRQTLNEFQQFTTPDDGRKFTDLYNVQHLRSNAIDPVSNITISTIQRLYSMLRGEAEMSEEDDERSAYESEPTQAVEVAYNADIPIETFDFIIVDECHRSIYGLWRQVLEYFDAHLIGLTATPSNQTFGFFNKNLVMEYDHTAAVADGVNVDFDVYRIRTRIGSEGAEIAEGDWVGFRDRATRRLRWEAADEPLQYDPSDLDRKVVARDQIRTVVRAFRVRLPEIFPGRTEVPKTLIFAKDDSHADDIVQVVREEFGKGNEFAQKITYRTTDKKPEELLAQFRTTYNPRVVVTVDMIATGTDIKPLECVFFMRATKSRTFFEQMKGRGVRVISDADGLSGIASCSSPVVLGEGAGQSATGTCSDQAGNGSAPATASNINVDKTKPVVTVTGVANGASYIVGGVPAAGCSTTDALSGVATPAGLTAVGGPIGSVTVTCAGGTDKAGNTAAAVSATYTVTYQLCTAQSHDDDEDDDHGGSRAKGHESGSTIPVKIRLCDANGRNVGSSSLKVKAIGLTPPASLADAGKANPGNFFRFDDGQYIFNLQTKGLPAGTYTLDFQAGNDPTVYHYSFTIRPDEPKNGKSDDKGGKKDR